MAGVDEPPAAAGGFGVPAVCCIWMPICTLDDLVASTGATLQQKVLVPPRSGTATVRPDVPAGSRTCVFSEALKSSVKVSALISLTAHSAE